MHRWLLGLALVLPAVAGAVTVVAEGQAKAVLVVPEGAPEQQRQAAELLARYVKESTGAELAIVAERQAGQAAVLVGRSAEVDKLRLKLDKLDEDGYVLKGVDAGTYVVAGPTDWGTEFGVVELLERYLGVRWLLPGEMGTDVPKLRSVELPAAEVRGEPVFFSRLLSGLRGPVQAEWARRNRMHGRVSFHHNLLHLFPPSKYFATHPEFFPVVGGQRYQPKDDVDHRWQPNFSAPGIVDEAIINIKQFFRDHPEATSYSLGINDGRLYDESPESLARESGKLNMLGIRDVSDSYYQWCNEVVEGVLKEYPDKWFGLLAYSNAFEPPQKVKVNPRIIPYMTYDRMKWVKPELRGAGEELTRRWHEQSPTLGWYDYAYGAPYCLPRVYPHQMATYLRFGRDHGVRAHYAEIYENWGEGPKAYLYLKLQWDPSLDVDAALDDWYRRCVGPAAAPLLKEYYAIWERFWTETAPTTEWWTDQGQYLPFSRAGYLAQVDEADVRRSRKLVDDCLAQAVTPEQKWRAGLLRDAFAYYEASALAFKSDLEARAMPLATEEQALQALEHAAERAGMAVKRLQLVEQWKDHPVLQHPLDYARYGALRGAGWGGGSMFRLFDWARRSDRVKARLEELAKGPESEAKTHAQALLAVLGAGGEMVSKDPSFEDAKLGWSTWIVDGVGSMKVTDEAARSGARSMVCAEMKRGGPNQLVPVTAGRYAAVAQIMLPAGQKPSGTVALSPTMRGEDNVNLPSPSTTAVLEPGAWTTLVCPVTVPEKINGKDVTRILLVVVVDSFQPGDKVFMDDVALYRLPD